MEWIWEEAAGQFPAICFCRGREEKGRSFGLVWFGLFNRSSRARALLDSTELGEEEKISQQRSRAHM
jgi:hypothetical protein